MVQLGDKVKCTVTGYTGIATGITYFLYGCARVGVTGVAKKGEKPKDGYWVDEPQLKVIKKAAVKVDKVRKKGGPMSSIPTHNETPGR